MLDIVTGLPHPDLEQALVKRILRIKTTDPFDSLLILVPSEFLRKRLVWRLCVDHDQPLFNVQVLTFFQLALRLVHENGQDSTVHLHSDFVLKECVHHVLLRHQAALPTLMALREIPGAWAALWATVKDLKDGTVDPEMTLEALSQSEFATQANLESLFRLYKLVLDLKQEFQMYDADDVAGLAVEGLSSSKFLEAQTDILYYGFYDLTQVQLDLFKRIAQSYPTTLFFPLIPRHTAFQFAKQFFDRHICGLLTDPLKQNHSGTKGFALRQLFLSEPELSGVPGETPGPDCRIVEVSGVEDEIEFVAKAILQHVEGGQIAFHDMAVVGRTLSGYTHILPRVFADHGIPLYSTMSRTLAEWPLVKLAIQLLDLRNGDFRRDQILDVISSPFFNVAASGSSVQDRVTGPWEVITGKLGIQKGIKEWERLRTYREPAEATQENSLKDFGGSPTQIASLWTIVSDILEMLQSAPEQASLVTYEEHAQHVISSFINPSPTGDQVVPLPVPSVSKESAREGNHDVNQQNIFDALTQRVQELRTLSPLYGNVAYSEFVSLLKRLLEESQVSLEGHAQKCEGVWVLDAMAARGLSFRVLFVIGLTEKVFPRHIREDAFLRDDVRKWINESLGYKVPEKLAGYDEEKLLFYLLVNSAVESLTLLYQRSDQSGRQQIPSSYLNDVQRCLGSVPPIVVPRRLSQKCSALMQYETRRLTPREYGITCLLNRQRWTPTWKDAYAIGDLFEQGMMFLQGQESHQDHVGPYDGVTGVLPEFWTRLQGKGLSPTSLETYARCPFQYFAKQVLGLEPLSEKVQELDSREVGNLVHEVLTAYFRTLVGQGYFRKETNQAIDFDTLLRDVAEPIFKSYASSHAVGYPILWDIKQQALVDLLLQVIRKDVEELGKDWVPVMFEESLTGLLPVMLSEGLHQLRIEGRIDRIDWSPERNAYRIIDYKYSERTSQIPLSSRLLLEVVRGTRLQPPFYIKLTESSIQERLGEIQGEETPAQMNCDNVWFYWISPNGSQKAGALTRVSFPGDAWRSAFRAPLEKVINHCVEGIHRGHFFMTPGSQCTWCEYQLACHRRHELSASRARVDHALIKPHRRIRQQKPPAGTSSDKPTKT